MFLLRYEGLRQTVKIEGIGEVKLIPDMLLRLTDRELVNAFIKSVKGIDKRGREKEKKGNFTCVSRPALPGEEPDYVLSDDIKDEKEDSNLEEEEDDD